MIKHDISTENSSTLPEHHSVNDYHDESVIVEYAGVETHPENAVMRLQQDTAPISEQKEAMTGNPSNSSINLVLSERITRYKINRNLQEAKLSKLRKTEEKSDHGLNTHLSVPKVSNQVSPCTLSPSNENENATNHTLLNKSVSSNHLDIELDENRQRLYVDTGRPRPFRRLYDTNVEDNNDNHFGDNIEDENITIRSYQESYVSFSNVPNHQARPLQVMICI